MKQRAHEGFICCLSWRALKKTQVLDGGSEDGGSISSSLVLSPPSSLHSPLSLVLLPFALPPIFPSLSPFQQGFGNSPNSPSTHLFGFFFSPCSSAHPLLLSPNCRYSNHCLYNSYIFFLSPFFSPSISVLFSTLYFSLSRFSISDPIP